MELEIRQTKTVSLNTTSQHQLSPHETGSESSAFLRRERVVAGHGFLVVHSKIKGITTTPPIATKPTASALDKTNVAALICLVPAARAGTPNTKQRIERVTEMKALPRRLKSRCLAIRLVAAGSR